MRHLGLIPAGGTHAHLSRTVKALGIDTSHLLTMQLALANEKYPTPAQKAAFYDRIDERLAAVSGVTSATIATSVPLMAQVPISAPTASKMKIAVRPVETLAIAASLRSPTE